LTHYSDLGGLDQRRIEAHLRSLVPFAPAWLVPGSTGDGWELSRDETRQLLDLVLAVAEDHEAHVLIGALHPEAAAARQEIQDTQEWLRQRAGSCHPDTVFQRSRVCGFAVCPPAGSHLSQVEISLALASILELDVPLALYQLPQITQNEMAPETVAELAQRFPNFYLFKDTSGQDRVATAQTDLADVFLVRGAEGDYHRWLKMAGGPYDGFLLSTANVFARQLHEYIQVADGGETQRAEDLIRPVEQLVAHVFSAAQHITVGNVFANANKAVDHFMAHGPTAERISPPRLHAGPRLDTELIRRTGELLRQNNLLPERGYLAYAGDQPASSDG
jgi:dihydrodipicolinate synthase/N-acetylneuraminate lyase